MVFSSMVVCIGVAAAGVFSNGPITDLEGLKSVCGSQERTMVVLSAPWCLACKQMDQTTWIDEDLNSALDGTQVCSVTEALLPSAMEWLKAGGIPTLILYENGEERGRLHGYQNAEQVMEWLDNPDRVIEMGNPNMMPIGELHDRGIDLLLEQRYGDAAVMLTACWVRSVSDDGTTDFLRWMRRDRYPSMLAHIAKDVDGRAVLEGVFSVYAEEGPNVGEDDRVVRDWIVLCQSLGKDAELDVWIRRNLRIAKGIEMLSRQERVFDLLVDAEEWSDAGIIASGIMWERWVSRFRGEPTGNKVSDAANDRVIAKEQSIARERLSLFIKSLDEARRSDEARALAELIE